MITAQTSAKQLQLLGLPTPQQLSLGIVIDVEPHIEHLHLTHLLIHKKYSRLSDAIGHQIEMR